MSRDSRTNLSRSRKTVISRHFPQALCPDLGLDFDSGHASRYLEEAVVEEAITGDDAGVDADAGVGIDTDFDLGVGTNRMEHLKNIDAENIAGTADMVVVIAALGEKIHRSVLSAYACVGNTPYLVDLESGHRNVFEVGKHDADADAEVEMEQAS